MRMRAARSAAFATCTAAARAPIAAACRTWSTTLAGARVHSRADGAPPAARMRDQRPRCRLLTRRRLRALRGRELRGPEPEPLREAVERAAEHDAGRVAADLAARLRSARGEIRVGVLFNTLEERTAADSVDRPNVTPSVQSIKLPAWIMIVLSMRPKPTMGTAQTRKWRESSRRGAAAADDACREAATRAGDALPRVRSRRARAAARPRRQAARRRISEQWLRLRLDTLELFFERYQYRTVGIHRIH